MAETTCPECGAETSGADPCPACGEALAKSTDDRPLNVIDAKAIVVKVLWGTGALMLCGGLGALSIGATKPAVGLLRPGRPPLRRLLRGGLVDLRGQIKPPWVVNKDPFVELEETLALE